MAQAIKNPYFLEKINQARVSLYCMLLETKKLLDDIASRERHDYSADLYESDPR